MKQRSAPYSRIGVRWGPAVTQFLRIPTTCDARTPPRVGPRCLTVDGFAARTPASRRAAGAARRPQRLEYRRVPRSSSDRVRGKRTTSTATRGRGRASTGRAAADPETSERARLQAKRIQIVVRVLAELERIEPTTDRKLRCASIQPKLKPEICRPNTFPEKPTRPTSSPAAPATTISGSRCSSRGWTCRAAGAATQLIRA